MRTKPRLRELQLSMKRIITDPRGAGPALAEAGLSFPTGIDVYAEAYFWRILGSMESDFPATKAVSGEDFARAVAQYLTRFPSRTPNIGEVGRFFASFLEEYPVLAERPWLPELARLEWLVIESFYSETLPALDPAKLASIPPDAWGDASIVIDPSARSLKAGYQVQRLWEKRAAEILEPGPCHLLIHRPYLEVQVRELPEAELHALTGLREGKCLAEVCEDLPAQTDVTALFGEWVRLGLIRDVIPKKDG